MWLKHSSAAVAPAVAAAADAAAVTGVVVDPVFLGGVQRWRAKETDAFVIR
jgi:hypothetical protein